MFYQETLFTGTPGDTYEALETDLSLSPQGPHWGTWRVAPLLESSGNGAYTYLSIGALQGEPWGWILYWESWRICKGRLWKQAPLSIEALLKNPKGVYLPGTFSDNKRALLKWRISLFLSLNGSSMRGTWRESFYTADFDRHVMGNGAGRASILRTLTDM